MEDRFLKRIQDEFYKTKNDPTMDWRSKEAIYKDLLVKMGRRYVFEHYNTVKVNSRTPKEVALFVDVILEEKNKLLFEHTAYKSSKNRCIR